MTMGDMFQGAKLPMKQGRGVEKRVVRHSVDNYRNATVS